MMAVVTARTPQRDFAFRAELSDMPFVRECWRHAKRIRTALAKGSEPFSRTRVLPDPVLTAIHEAGHAVVAAHKGEPIRCVRLNAPSRVPDFDALGVFMSSDTKDFFGKRSNPRRALDVLFGGIAAEKLIGRVTVPYGAWGDLKDIYDIAVDLADGAEDPTASISALVSSAQATANRLVKFNSEAVWEIAAGLLEHGRLSGDEVLAITGCHRSPDDPDEEWRPRFSTGDAVYLPALGQGVVVGTKEDEEGVYWLQFGTGVVSMSESVLRAE